MPEHEHFWVGDEGASVVSCTCGAMRERGFQHKGHPVQRDAEVSHGE